jgi:hypothetical protein
MYMIRGITELGWRLRRTEQATYLLLMRDQFGLLPGWGDFWPRCSLTEMISLRNACEKGDEVVYPQYSKQQDGPNNFLKQPPQKYNGSARRAKRCFSACFGSPPRVRGVSPQNASNHTELYFDCNMVIWQAHISQLAERL